MNFVRFDGQLQMQVDSVQIYCRFTGCKLILVTQKHSEILHQHCFISLSDIVNFLKKSNQSIESVPYKFRFVNSQSWDFNIDSESETQWGNLVSWGLLSLKNSHSILNSLDYF